MVVPIHRHGLRRQKLSVMSRSWLRCLFAPRAAAREIAGMARQIGEMGEVIGKRDSELQSMQCTVMTQRETALIQARQLRTLHETIAEMERQAADLNGRLENESIDRERVEEMRSEIAQFGTERQQYERRINALKKELADTRKALKQLAVPDFEDTPAPIDMGEDAQSPTPARNPEAKTAKQDTAAAATDDEDWLLQLPDDI